MKMRRFGSIALAALALGAICLPPAEAAYKPKVAGKMGGQFTTDVKKAVATLKSMPKSVRWDLLAEKLGLLFMPSNGAFGNDSSTGEIRVGSHFIGADGKEYDAKAEFKSISWETGGWKYSAAAIDRLGQEAVFSKISSEVTTLVLKNAKYQLDKLAEELPEMREMCLAYLAKLCYLPDGKSPYGKMETRTGPHKQPFQYYKLGGKGCLFVDTEGTEHKYEEVHRKYDSLGGNRWSILTICAHHVGAKDILALFPDEVKKLRAAYKKKMQELEAGATEPNEDKANEDKSDEETSEPSEKVESLAAKLGVTYQSKMNTDRMGGQFKKDLDSVLEYLKSLPQSQRWTFLAERMGMMFMPQDRSRGQDWSSGYSSKGWLKEGSHFIGANGLEYDAMAELDVINNNGTRSEWDKCSDITERLGREVIFSQFPDEVAELALQNAKYHLEMAAEVPEGRDSFLARLAQLEYLPNGNSSYVRQSWKWGQTNVVYEHRLIGSGDKFHFVDSEGKEHRTVDAYKSIYNGRWGILIICANHLGSDAILALCPEEVKKMRANYEKKMQEFKK